jgi:hypothetical protein
VFGSCGVPTGVCVIHLCSESLDVDVRVLIVRCLGRAKTNLVIFCMVHWSVNKSDNFNTMYGINKSNLCCDVNGGQHSLLNAQLPFKVSFYSKYARYTAEHLTDTKRKFT